MRLFYADHDVLATNILSHHHLRQNLALASLPKDIRYCSVQEEVLGRRYCLRRMVDHRGLYEYLSMPSLCSSLRPCEPVQSRALQQPSSLLYWNHCLEPWPRSSRACAALTHGLEAEATHQETPHSGRDILNGFPVNGPNDRTTQRTDIYHQILHRGCPPNRLYIEPPEN